MSSVSVNRTNRLFYVSYSNQNLRYWEAEEPSPSQPVDQQVLKKQAHHRNFGSSPNCTYHLPFRMFSNALS